MSSKKSTPRMKHGEEPTELLLALVSSPLETLCQRNKVQIFSANTPEGQPVVLAVFVDALLDAGTIVLANGKDDVVIAKNVETPKKEV